MDPEKILHNLSSDKWLPPEEQEEIINFLELVLQGSSLRNLSVDDAYTSLLIVGKARLYEQRSLLEKFLNYQDGLTAALVLEILCLEWGYVENYLERVIQFAVGVSWDVDGDVQQVAMKILGEYVSGNIVSPDNTAKGGDAGQRKRVLEFLIGIFSDLAIGDWVRQGSYHALLRAAGKDWEEVPSDCKKLSLEEGSAEIDWELIALLKEDCNYGSQAQDCSSGFPSKGSSDFSPGT